MSDQHGKDWYDISDFGDISDESIQTTKIIQAAIDKCNENGGGIVHFPTGKYNCGTLILKSNITLNISAGAILRFNDKRQNFLKPEKLLYKPYADFETSYFYFSLVMGENIENVIIEGGGIIENITYKRGGPKPIALKLCKNIIIRNITIKNAPNYAISFIGCENITINNIKILDAQADGIDFDNCQLVRVFNCYIDAFDDGICLKTSLALGKLSFTSNISINNCDIGSSCNCVKLGTESNGDFKNITFTHSNIFARINARKAIAGIAIESVDGANIKDIIINNVKIQGVNCPIFLRLGYRGRGKNPSIPGTLKNVSFSNIMIIEATFPCIFAGIPHHSINNINLQNILIEYNDIKESPREKVVNELYHQKAKSKIGTSILNLPEAIKNYPEADMFGLMPVWGLYGRHLKEISFKNVHFSLKPQIPFFNLKSSLIFEDAHNLNIQGIELAFLRKDLKEVKKDSGESNNIIWFNQVSSVNINNCQIKFPYVTAIRISGKDTKDISIKLQDLKEETILKVDPEVPQNEVKYEKH